MNMKKNLTTKNLGILDAATIVATVLWNYDIAESDINVSRACRIYNRMNASMSKDFDTKFWYDIVCCIMTKKIKWH